MGTTVTSIAWVAEPGSDWVAMPKTKADVRSLLNDVEVMGGRRLSELRWADNGEGAAIEGGFAIDAASPKVCEYLHRQLGYAKCTKIRLDVMADEGI